MKNIVLNYKTVACLAILFAHSTAQAQLPTKPNASFTDWTMENYEIKGNIASISIHDSKKQYDKQTIYFNEQGMVTRNNTASSIAAHISAIRTIGETINTYNKQGRITLQTFTGTHQTYYSKIKYDYEKDGLTSVVSHYKKDAPDSLYNKVKHSYDAKGHITHVSRFRDNKLERVSSFDAYDYDKNGNLISIGDYKCINGSNCDESGSETFKYNEQKQLISTNKNFAGVNYGTTFYKYNKQQQLVSIEKSIDGITNITLESFEYNDKGLVAKKIAIVNNKTITSVYTYDEKGNWITCTRNDGSEEQVLKRTITYR